MGALLHAANTLRTLSKDSMPFWGFALASLALHGLSWLLTAKLGHEVLEAPVKTGKQGQQEDSNLYFRRGYYVGSNLGTKTTVVDRIAQFCISPLALVLDCAWQWGFRSELGDKVSVQKNIIIERLAAGASPLGSFEVLSAACKRKGVALRVSLHETMQSTIAQKTENGMAQPGFLI